jgi:hypothetical protein
VKRVDSRADVFGKRMSSTSPAPTRYVDGDTDAADELIMPELGFAVGALTLSIVGCTALRGATMPPAKIDELFEDATTEVVWLVRSTIAVFPQAGGDAFASDRGAAVTSGFVSGRIFLLST